MVVKRSILVTGENASTGRPDARSTLFGPGGFQKIILNIDFLKLSGMSRITRRMGQDELAAMEQNYTLVTFCQNQGFHRAVTEYQQ